MSRLAWTYCEVRDTSCMSMAVFEIVVFCLEVGLVQVLILDGKLARMEGEFARMEGKDCGGGGSEACDGLEGDGCLTYTC